MIETVRVHPVPVGRIEGFDQPLLRVKVLDVFVSIGLREEFMDEFLRLSHHDDHSAYVCFMNVHMLVEANQDLAFRAVVHAADVICPDGLPVAMSVGWFFAIRQEQIAGPDTLPALMAAAHRTGLKIFLLGSTEEVIANFRARATLDYSDQLICGHACPPFRTLTDVEDQALVDQINDDGADMIFVALGCPKQERWMSAHRGRVGGCMFGLGYAIPVYAGVESRAPRWMIDHGLEWLFRLHSDPRRLFRRYVETNSIFVRRALLRTLQNIIRPLFHIRRKVKA